MDAHDEAEFEALFTDAYWERMRSATIKLLEDRKDLGDMAEEVPGEQSEDQTDVPESLYDALIRDAGKRPAYLTNVTSDFKEMLRQHYEERLSSAQQCAEEIGTCDGCGSTNIVGTVGTGVSKFKSCVGCNNCGALLQWY